MNRDGLHPSELITDVAIRDAFERRARRAEDAGLRDAIVGRTATLPQQRGWMVRLLDAVARPRIGQLVILLAALALLTALAAGLLVVGQQGPVQWSLLITTARGSDCYQAARGDLSTAVTLPLTDCVSGAHQMRISPDGLHALFVRQGHLVLQDLAAGTQQDITPGDELTAYDHAYDWSPRGTWFSWTICPSRSSCTTSILPADGAGTPRTMSVRYQTGPSWSPDETRMAYEALDGLIIARGDGGEPRPLALDIPVVSEWVPAIADWSPDGSRVAYLRDGNVWVAGIDGTGAQALTDFATGGIDEVAWSPDGLRLAVVRSATVWLVALDGSRARLDPGLTDGPGLAGDGEVGVAWAPNGKILAVSVADATTTATSLVPIDGGSPTVLPGVAGPVTDPRPQTFSPDSKRVAYVGADGSIYVASLDGSGTHRVLPSVSRPDSLTWVATSTASRD